MKKNIDKIIYKEVMEFAVNERFEDYRKLRMRCLMEGCRYGYKQINKKPKENCIYCGEEKLRGLNGETIARIGIGRAITDFLNMQRRDLVNKLLKKNDKLDK